MSPTVLKKNGLRFYFFSREEPRIHVHIQASMGEAKFWLEPKVELAENYGLPPRILKLAKELTLEHFDEICEAWRRHFSA